MPSTVKLLFVCLGNICRSPCAEGVMRRKVEAAGLEESILIDSAGTADWHTGNLPDSRMRQHAKQRGYTLDSHARGVALADFSQHDLILAMDEDNKANLLRMAPDAASRAKVQLFCDYAHGHDTTEVPDPYYGGPEGFETVLDLVEDGCSGLLSHARGMLARS